MTIKSSKTLIEEALKLVKTISSKEALEKLKNKECNLIDIREISELEQTGALENTVHIPRSMLEFFLDPESIYFQEGKLDINKEMILFCAGGLRSALSAKMLQEMGYKKISHVEGGFASMQSAGFEIK
tara:strand:+ start:1174 stop:1557 length:384 start_codon:yes stop_codon:yes gene_type:complete